MWNVNAAAWDEAQGQAGNAFQRELVFPAAEQLLDIPACHYEKASLPRLVHWAYQLLTESALPFVRHTLGSGSRCWRLAAATAPLRAGCLQAVLWTTCWRPTLHRNSCAARATRRLHMSTHGCASRRLMPRADRVC